MLKSVSEILFPLSANSQDDMWVWGAEGSHWGLSQCVGGGLRCKQGPLCSLFGFLLASVTDLLFHLLIDHYATFSSELGNLMTLEVSCWAELASLTLALHPPILNQILSLPLD